jgi:ATP-dependent Clp protease ATP-binding subunit ClpA
MEEGVAATALERLGVTTASLQQAVDRLFGRRTWARPESPPLSLEATDALGAAVALSRSDPCEVLRTEHLLFVLATDPGGRARRVLNAVGVQVADVKRELEPCLPRTRRRRRRLRTKSRI